MSTGSLITLPEYLPGSLFGKCTINSFSRFLAALVSRVSLLYYHLILVVKYRKNVLVNESLSVIEDSISDILIEHDCELIEFNGESNLIHAVIRLIPDIKLSYIVGRLKQESTKRVFNLNINNIRNDLWGDELWTSSYFIVSTGGVILDKLLKYVNNQNRPN